MPVKELAITLSIREAAWIAWNRRRWTAVGPITSDMEGELQGKAMTAMQWVKLALLHQNKSMLHSKKRERFNCEFINPKLDSMSCSQDLLQELTHQRKQAQVIFDLEWRHWFSLILHQEHQLVRLSTTPETHLTRRYILKLPSIFPIRLEIMVNTKLREDRPSKDQNQPYQELTARWVSRTTGWTCSRHKFNTKRSQDQEATPYLPLEEEEFP